jgi:hypothetical protein
MQLSLLGAVPLLLCWMLFRHYTHRCPASRPDFCSMLTSRRAGLRSTTDESQGSLMPTRIMTLAPGAALPFHPNIRAWSSVHCTNSGHDPASAATPPCTVIPDPDPGEEIASHAVVGIVCRSSTKISDRSGVATSVIPEDLEAGLEILTLVKQAFNWALLETTDEGVADAAGCDRVSESAGLADFGVCV